VNFVARSTPSAGLTPSDRAGEASGASNAEEESRMSPRGGRRRHEPTAGLSVEGRRRCERVRRSIEEHAREDLARFHPHRGPQPGQRSSVEFDDSAMLSDALRHGLRGTGASATSIKGTDTTVSRRVRGTSRGQP
jgi:hypothetical protein